MTRRFAELLRWLFTWRGNVGPLHYFVAGVALTFLKYSVDSTIAARFGVLWLPWNYFLNTHFRQLLHGPGARALVPMCVVALPFFWVGIGLTLRRLRSARLGPGLLVLFFVPLVNLVFFLALSVVPARASGDEPLPSRDAVTAATLAVTLSVALALVLIVLNVDMLALYGTGLFLGVPFFVGFIAAAVFNWKTPRTAAASIRVALLATTALAVVILGVAMEGLVCVLMALPLALPLATAGALAAHGMLSGRRHVRPSAPHVATWLVVLPLAMFLEYANHSVPPVLTVTSAVEINAPPEVVWRNVISFSPLAEPTELLFRSGIAYPKNAVIMGRGVGAVRYCRFSTGDFVEPFTVWDENHRLAFDVAGQPPAMRELSFAKITPPHVQHNYMRSRHGQFLLLALPGGRTRLEGTTWYQNYFWPQPYWRLWSDYIVHRIHMRVLRHVKQQAESAIATRSSR